MKYIKMLGLAAVAAAALMAWVGAGTASATEITCGATPATTSKCAVGATIHATSIGKAVLDAPFGNVECNSTVAGPVTTAGTSTTTAKGNITTLDWTNCGGDTVTTLASGSLEVHTEGGSANGNGTLTSTGARVTVIHLGVHCIYETNNTTIGTVTGSSNTKGHAVLDIKANVPQVSGGFLCGASAPWTGSYTVVTPAALTVH